MSRRVRHITARPNEWIKVHRPHQSGNAGCGFLILLLLICSMLKGCG